MRRRFKQAFTLEERLAQELEQLREQASNMKPGVALDQVLRRISTGRDGFSHERVATVSRPSGAAIVVMNNSAARASHSKGRGILVVRNQNERVALEMLIMKHRLLARRATDE